MNLIDINDPYIIIGPAVVAKNSIDDFMYEWKSNTTSLNKIQDVYAPHITPDEIINRLPNLKEYFPEIYDISAELETQLATTKCHACTINKFLYQIASIIKSVYDDGRDLRRYKNIS